MPSWLVGDALALCALVDAQRAQLLEQQAQLDELSATVAGLRAQAQAAAASSAWGHSLVGCRAFTLPTPPRVCLAGVPFKAQINTLLTVPLLRSLKHIRRE